MRAYTPLFDLDNKESLVSGDDFDTVAFQMIWGLVILQNTLKGKLSSPSLNPTFRENAPIVANNYMVGKNKLNFKDMKAFKVVLSDPQYEVNQTDMDADLKKLAAYLETRKPTGKYQRLLIKTLKEPRFHQGYGALAYLFSPLFLSKNGYWETSLVEDPVITFSKPSVKQVILDAIRKQSDDEKRLREEADKRLREEEKKKKKKKKERPAIAPKFRTLFQNIDPDKLTSEDQKQKYEILVQKAANENTDPKEIVKGLFYFD